LRPVSSGPWQWKHLSERIGRTSRVKSTGLVAGASDGVASAAETASGTMSRARQRARGPNESTVVSDRFGCGWPIKTAGRIGRRTGGVMDGSRWRCTGRASARRFTTETRRHRDRGGGGNATAASQFLALGRGTPCARLSPTGAHKARPYEIQPGPWDCKKLNAPKRDGRRGAGSTCGVRSCTVGHFHDVGVVRVASPLPPICVLVFSP
jgi:hypothetical protein